MSAVILRFVIYAIIAGALYFGIRKIWRDWTSHFRAEDKQKHQRDLKERQRPDVIDLKRSDDGVFRPPSRNDKSRDGRD
jgi:hypothetical protein